MSGENKKVTLTEYFQAVDRSLQKRDLMPRYGFKVKIADKVIQVLFPMPELENVGRLSLSGFIISDDAPEDAVFLYWYDTCDSYLPAGEGDISSVWQSADETGNLRIGTDTDSLVGCDYARKRYYFSRPATISDPQLTCRHTLVNAFARWARNNGMLLLHAAAVGFDGTGVLVAGRGGRGKSTFAVSCLAGGLDFVSDDYTLITAQDDLVAMPLYSCVGVRPDMLEKLGTLGEPNAYVLGKPMFEVPSDRFANQLKIGAIVLPDVRGDAEPDIIPVSGNNALAQIIHSTILQIESQHDTTLVKDMASRLSGVPVYEMSMSSDLKKNPALLKRFIREELEAKEGM